MEEKGKACRTPFAMLLLARAPSEVPCLEEEGTECGGQW